MTTLALLTVSVLSASSGGVSLSKAQTIAQAFADRAGFKVKVAALPNQLIDNGNATGTNGYPTDSQRKWYLGTPAMTFMVSASSGRLLEFRRGDRMDSGHQVTNPGPHAKSKAAFIDYARAVVKKLGLFRPARIQAMGIWDDANRPQSHIPDTVILYGSRRQIQLNFHPAGGDLVLFLDREDAPNVSPRDALKPSQGDVSGSEAIRAVGHLQAKLGFSAIQEQDSFATLQTLFFRRRSWHIDHPYVQANVDAKTGKVLNFRQFSDSRGFRPGDKPLVATRAAAEAHLRKIVARVGVPAAAKAEVKIVNEMVPRVGHIGQIRGSFKWASNFCNAICDLRTGELQDIDFLAPRNGPERARQSIAVKRPSKK